MIKISIFLCCFQAFQLLAIQPIAQVAINTTGSLPHPNAALDIKGVNKGLLIPRGDAATRTSLNSNTAKGLMMYDTVANSIWVHNGNGLATGWQSLSVGPNYWVQSNASGTEVKNTNTGGFWSANASTVLADPGAILPPVSGEGTRMMWIPQKSAIRIGTVDNNDWNADSIGVWSSGIGHNIRAKGSGSVAFGNGTIASGSSSTVFGSNTIASGDVSTAFGFGSKATGYKSFAAGQNTTASGENSTAMGTGTTASNYSSTAIGFSTTASGGNATAIGDQTEAIGNVSLAAGYHSRSLGNASTALGYITSAVSDYSTALGYLSSARGARSISIGHTTVAKAFSSLALGRFNDSIATSDNLNWVTTDPLLIVGNGQSDFARHNAMVVYKNGNMVLKNPTTVTSDPLVFTLPVNGAGTRMMWLPEKSAFRVGTVEGDEWSADNIGRYSFATGYNAKAKGNSSISLGDFTSANGFGSIATGVQSLSNGWGSFTSGFKTTTNGNYSVALGQETVSKAYSSLTIGRYNDSINSSTKNSWIYSDPLLILGNGTSDAARSNALVVYKNGNTEINGSLQVARGTKFSKMQGGSVLVGSSATVLKSVSFTFPASFTSVPKIVCTIVNDDPNQPNVNDTWVVSVRNISTTGCTVNVVRVDASSGWSSQAKIHWFAFTE